MEWQPIETAPKDGTDFLIDCENTVCGWTAATYEDGVLVSLWDGRPFADHVTKPKFWMKIDPPNASK